MIIALQMLIFFRESVLALLNGWLPPFFRQLVGKLSSNVLVAQEDELEDQVYADYDAEYGVVFFPPVHAQRYAAVCDCLLDDRWCGKLEKVLNIGNQQDINFMKYLTEIPGITQILGLDIKCSLNCSYDVHDLVFDDYEQRCEKPLQITLLEGNAADPDYRLIGCDAVIAINLLERLLPNDIDRLVHNVFGFIKPWVALFTTPNADFNCLINNLEKNGLRQPDHYFEWTREQLHDWCSNIVERYPGYMVLSRGVGPGPPGTSHYGCYSQLVVFISKCYKKEMELNVNSLVLVSNLPEPDEMSDIGWVTPSDVPSSWSMFHRLEESQSSELHYPDSSIEGTPYPSPVSSEMSFRQVDESSQCNLEVEFGKSFVMFNYEELYQIRMPKIRVYRTVYEIGDVASRLNNTTHEVKQFSKTSQYLLEKNEMDSTNTRDILNEISQLTDRLICTMNRGGEGHMWNNVNWGENVPYWNQYYKVVGVYNYPYEGKSEDDIILDLISEEITRIVDAQGIDGILRQGKQLEIPLEQLMEALQHITDDVDRVVMLLEDNGYEVDGEAVVHSTVEIADTGQEDDLDCNSECDILPSENALVPDYNGHVLNRALSCKVRKLQLLLPNDEDVKQALGQVICRLKKIAVRCGQGKQGAMRFRWLQLKLLDLLTMNEKSILRRKLRNVERDPSKRLKLDTGGDLSRIKAEDYEAMKIFEKYKNLLQMSAGERSEEFPLKYNVFTEALNICEQAAFEVEGDNLSPKDDTRRYILEEHELMDSEEKDTSLNKEEETNEPIYNNDTIRTKNSEHRKSHKESKVRNIRKMKTASSNNIICTKKSRHSNKHCPGYVAVKNVLKKTSSCKTLDRHLVEGVAPLKALRKFAFSNRLEAIENVHNINDPAFVVSVKSKPIPRSIYELCHPDLIQKTYAPIQKLDPRRSQTLSVSNTENGQMIEILTHDGTVTVALQRTFGTNPDENCEVYQLDVANLLAQAPSCVIAEAFLDGTITMEDEQSNEIMVYDAPEESMSYDEVQDPRDGPNDSILPTPLAVTEKTQIIEILTEDVCEIVALQRTVGTEPDSEVEVCEEELAHPTTLTKSLDDLAPHEDAPMWAGKVNSREFFLYDINEPTTSKGLRHVGMDVQCGTDAAMSNFAMLSATTSFTSPFNRFGIGLKIGDSIPDTAVMKTDCVTSTHEILKPCARNSSPWMRSVGIKIKDSCHQIDESSNKEQERPIFGPFSVLKNEHCVKTSPHKSKDIKTVRSSKKIENCGTVENGDKGNVYKNLGSSAIPIPISSTKRFHRPTYHPGFTVFRIKETPRPLESSDTVMRFLNQQNEMRPKLSCGGVQVHSYKDLLISEDVMYQGEWQRYRPRPTRKAPTYYTLKKPILHSTDKSKFTCKVNVPTKPQKPTIQWTKTEPVTLRNLKSNNKENMVNTNLQNKLQLRKLQVFRSKPEIIQKVSSNLVKRYPKPIAPKSRTVMQPTRPAKPIPQNNTIKDKKARATRSRNLYSPPSFNKVYAHQAAKVPSKSGIKPDSLSNLLIVSKGRKTPKSSQTKVSQIIDALLKISVEPPKQVNYVVYRNETETAKSSTAIEKIAVSARPSDKDNVLRRHISNLSQDSSTCSSRNSVATVLNPQSVNRTKPLKSRRQPPKKSSVARKCSDGKLLTRFKKLVNKMMIPKTSPLDVTRVGNIPGTSNLMAKSSSKSVAHQVLVNPTSNVFAASSKPSVTKSFTKISDCMNVTDARDKNIKLCNTQGLPTVLILNPHKKEIDDQTHSSPSMNSKVSSVSQESNSLQKENKKVAVDSYDNPLKSVVDYTNSLFEDMKQLIEESLDFIETPGQNLSKNNESADFKRPDFDNITTTGSGTCETDRTYDLGSLSSLAQSFTDVSFKSMPSASKTSECFADNESWNISQQGDCNSNSDCKVHEFETKQHVSINQPPQDIHGLSSLPMLSAEELSGRREPDYVNLVDSETGSYAVGVNRPSQTSEEVLPSNHSSETYVSCVLDEDAVIPTWLYNNENQQESDSYNSDSREAHDLPISDPDMPEPFALNYDENGNEVAPHGAGGGDGRGIHSDQSQDSSGRGSSFSSSADSSRVHSESIVIDPGTFAPQFQNVGEHASTSNVAPEMIQEETIDIPFTAAIENVNTPHSPNRDRIPRSARRVSLPASDADVSSDDTDVASDI